MLPIASSPSQSNSPPRFSSSDHTGDVRRVTHSARPVGAHQPAAAMSASRRHGQPIAVEVAWEPAGHRPGTSGSRAGSCGPGARSRPEGSFLRHLGVDLLREAFLALERDAAPRDGRADVVGLCSRPMRQTSVFGLAQDQVRSSDWWKRMASTSACPPATSAFPSIW
jgi:hypothetical protein